MKDIKYSKFIIATASFVFFSQLLACGGNSVATTVDTTASSAVITAVENGTSISTAATRWAAVTCNVQIQITADGVFHSAVTTGGTIYISNGTWTVSATDTNSAVITGNTGVYWVSSLNNISGSTTSKSFTGDVFVTDQAGAQSLGTCTFTLQNGTIP